VPALMICGMGESMYLDVKATNCRLPFARRRLPLRRLRPLTKFRRIFCSLRRLLRDRQGQPDSREEPIKLNAWVQGTRKPHEGIEGFKSSVSEILCAASEFSAPTRFNAALLDGGRDVHAGQQPLDG
jgi:hypothetical protein